MSPCSEAPGHRDTFEEHQEEQTHSTRGVLVKQLEHVDTALKWKMFSQMSHPSIDHGWLFSMLYHCQLLL